MKDKIKVGEWVFDGEAICFQEFYEIENKRLFEQDFGGDWLSHLRRKTWFTKECEHDFLEIFYIAMMYINRSKKVNDSIYRKKLCIC